MSNETLSVLDLIIENYKATKAEIKDALDKKLYDANIETELIYQLGSLNSLMTELERARKAYSEKKNVFW